MFNQGISILEKNLLSAYDPKSDYTGGFTDQGGCSVFVRVLGNRKSKKSRVQISFESPKARNFLEFVVPSGLVLQKLNAIQFSN